MLGVVAIVALVAVLTGSVSPSQATPSFTPPEVGVVRLHMDHDGKYVRFDSSNGNGGYVIGAPSPITVSKCVATVTGALAITPTPAPPTGSLGLDDYELGVKVSGEGTSRSCGRVDGLSQALTVVPNGPVATKQFDFAELDMEVRYGGTVKADLYLNSQLVRTERLVTGASRDSGSDYDDRGNYRWRVPAADAPTTLFDKIVLSVDASTPRGAFTLGGGEDHTPPGPLGTALGTRDSLFHVVSISGILNCGDTANAGTPGNPTATLNRLPNGLGTPQDCAAIPYVLRTGVDDSLQTTELLKDLSSQAALQPAFTLTINWQPETAAYPVTRTTQIDFGGGPQPAQWCNGTSLAPTLPAGVAWCLSAQSVSPAGTGLVQVTESFYGAGDPKYLR